MGGILYRILLDCEYDEILIEEDMELLWWESRINLLRMLMICCCCCCELFLLVCFWERLSEWERDMGGF